MTDELNTLYSRRHARATELIQAGEKAYKERAKNENEQNSLTRKWIQDQLLDTFASGQTCVMLNDLCDRDFQAKNNSYVVRRVLTQMNKADPRLTFACERDYNDMDYNDTTFCKVCFTPQ